jgi:hypothetical protein
MSIKYLTISAQIKDAGTPPAEIDKVIKSEDQSLDD